MFKCIISDFFNRDAVALCRDNGFFNGIRCIRYNVISFVLGQGKVQTVQFHFFCWFGFRLRLRFGLRFRLRFGFGFRFRLRFGFRFGLGLGFRFGLGIDNAAMGRGIVYIFFAGSNKAAGKDSSKY